jgi:hypothetical protein
LINASCMITHDNKVNSTICLYKLSFALLKADFQDENQ